MAPGWNVTRYMRVRGKGFTIFGDKDEPVDQLTIILKLPISYEMIQDLPFVRQGSLWYRQHQWAVVHFDTDDDILAELDTLQGWMRQSYRAMAPRKLARLVEG